MFVKANRNVRQSVVSLIGAIAASTLCLGVAAAPVRTVPAEMISHSVPAGQHII
jgi:hypothetical protein